MGSADLSLAQRGGYYTARHSKQEILKLFDQYRSDSETVRQSDSCHSKQSDSYSRQTVVQTETVANI